MCGILLGVLKKLWGLVEDKRYGDVLFGYVLDDIMVVFLVDTCYVLYLKTDFSHQQYLVDSVGGGTQATNYLLLPSVIKRFTQKGVTYF